MAFTYNHMSAWTSSHALGITIESILFIQNFVKVIHLHDRTCQYNSNYDTNKDCMDTTLECTDGWCQANINSSIRTCAFNTYMYNQQTINVSIRCCFCNNSINNIPQQWWDCDNTTSSVSPSRSLTGEQ